MSYKVIRSESGKPAVILNGEPTYCTALEAAPITREPELHKGRWLVMCFAAWSVPDIQAIQIALDTVKHFDGSVNLGLRPFDTQDEHAVWCPVIAQETRSPLWIVLHDGTVFATLTGFPGAQALIGAIQAASSVL